MGRPLGRQQVFWNGSAWKYYQTWYSYDLAGHLTWMQYPSGHTVNYKYDEAGRLADSGGTAAFTGNLGDGVTRNYDSISGTNAYDAASRMQEEKFGTTPTPLYHKQHFNIRGQLYDMRLSAQSWTQNPLDGNRGALINYYSTQNFTPGYSGSDNNGNLMRQDVFIPNDDQGSSYTSWWQNYHYDSLNRLDWVKEWNASSQFLWQQFFTYDRWGNRTIDQGNTTSFIPHTPFNVDADHNRLTVPGAYSGTMTYDPAGNLSYDSYSGQGERDYDAENRMTKAWANGQWQVYTYDGEGYRVRRNVNNQETWQVYDVRGELLAEYAANAATSSPQKEYGYRNGQLLVTLTPGSGGSGQGTQNVVWTNAVNVSVNGNNLSKTGGDGWNGGAVSTQTIVSGDGYVDWTASSASSANVMIGLSNGDTDQNYTDIDFAIYLWTDGRAYAYHAGVNSWVSVAYAAGDHFRVSVENNVVKYYQNGTLWYTSPYSPTYPLLVDTSLYANGSTLTSVVISGNLSGGSGATDVEWIVTDHLGTPRIIADATGSLAGIKRHDYLPFGEELFAGTGGRTTAQGYSANDGMRQHFTQKERDNETGLDYFLARYYSSTQGRFTSPDEFTGGPEEVGVLGSGHPEKQALKYAEVTNPQSLNKYQYSFNNPLRYVDPDGQNPQEGLEIQIRHDEKALLEGRMSPEEFRERQVARGVGAAIGAAIVVAALYGPEVATAILMWASRNPDKVGQIALDLNQASTGSPAPGSPGLSIAAETRLTATEVSTGVRLAVQTGTRLAESPFVGEDFVSTAGKTYDAMGGAKAFQNFGNGSKFFDSIVHHVNKSVDYVAIDLKGASAKQINAIQKFVGGLTKKQQEKIIYVKE
jgi:RHS repeat-associated protein